MAAIYRLGYQRGNFQELCYCLGFGVMRDNAKIINQFKDYLMRIMMNVGRVIEMWFYCCIARTRHAFDMKNKTICYTHTIRFNCTLKIEYLDRNT